MKNRKGFTLTELLAVIVILGIVGLISIPVISNLSASFQKKQYTNYLDSVTASAKLYNDSYSEDLFGHKDNGCSYVSYQQLVDKNLLSDIKVKDMSCDSEHTFVKIHKIKSKYYYTTFIACWDKTHGNKNKIVVSLPDSTVHDMDPTLCTGTEANNVVVSVKDNEAGPTFNKKRKTTNLILKSETGINTEMNILTGWSKTQNAADVTNWVNADIKIKVNQEEELQKGHIIEAKSQQMVTPENQSGAFYLIVKVQKLSDLFGTEWKNPNPANGNVLVFGPFSVDSEAPTIPTFNITTTHTRINSKAVKIEIVGNDTYTQAKDLKMCIKEGEECTDNYVKYASPKNLTLSGDYDGKERTVYITFKDLAGNTKTINKKYRVAASSKITYKNQSGSGCSSDTVLYNVDKMSETKWLNLDSGDLCKPTRNYYTFAGWNTKADGSGTTITKDSTVTGDITVYAQWTKNRVIFRYMKQSDETLTATTYSEAGERRDWNVNSNGYITLKRNGGTEKLLADPYDFDFGKTDLYNYNNTHCLEIKKTGYKAVSGQEWICVSGCTTANTKFNHASQDRDLTTVCNCKKGDCYVDVKVNWTAATYTITYNANGGSGAPSSQSWTYSPKSEGNTIKLSTTKPTKTGYTFLGWSTSSTATSASYKPGDPWGCHNSQNYTLYAVWQAATYTITYNANGGTGAPNSQSWTYSPKSEGNTIKLSTTKPTRTGYKFLGWSTSSTASVSSYNPGDPWGCHNSQNYTLYAVWQANTYTLTYNNQSGSGCSSKTGTYDSKWGDLCTPSRTGYTFGGWFTSTNGGGTQVTKNTKVTGNQTVYAKWTAKSYTLTYNNQSGSGCTSKSGTYDSTWGDLCTPSRSGYNFGGWFTSTNGGGTQVTKNTKVTGNQTVYAKWTQAGPFCPSVAWSNDNNYTPGTYTPGTCSYDYITATFTFGSDVSSWDWELSSDNGVTYNQKKTGKSPKAPDNFVTITGKGNRALRITVHGTNGGTIQCEYKGLCRK